MMLIKSFNIHKNGSKINLISLNWENTNFMHFSLKNNSLNNFHIMYKDKKVTAVDRKSF
jgi:hypothetical protein